MKISGVVLLHLLMMAAQAQPPTEGFDGQAWQAPYVLPKPKGWGVERFPIPIAFAPEIPYKGVEDIRFAPGWAQAHSAAYWSYAFLWYLEGNVQLDTAKLRHHLAAYYTGLIAANGGHIPSDQLIPVAVSAMRTQRVGEDIDTYRGRVTMLDYMGKRPITLHYKAHIRQCPGKNHTFIFFELSPRPYTDGIWQKLGRLWRQFGCGN